MCNIQVGTCDEFFGIWNEELKIQIVERLDWYMERVVWNVEGIVCNMEQMIFNVERSVLDYYLLLS